MDQIKVQLMQVVRVSNQTLQHDPFAWFGLLEQYVLKDAYADFTSMHNPISVCVPCRCHVEPAAP
jgi:hypothetical protein